MTNTTRTWLLLPLLSLVALCGCAPLHTRLFYAHEIAVECRELYCFYPRIVAFDNVSKMPRATTEHAFWVSLKVYDPATPSPPTTLTVQGNHARASFADQFLAHLHAQFSADSLRLLLSTGDMELMLPDTSSFAPRGANYVSIQFGAVEIPLDVRSLTAVFYYHYTSASGPGDSLLFVMSRLEQHEQGTLHKTFSDVFREDRDEL